MKDQKSVIIETGLSLMAESGCQHLFLFLCTNQDCKWLLKSDFAQRDDIVVVVPKGFVSQDVDLKAAEGHLIESWSGSQTRFSRIKYAFLRGVLQGIITTESKVVCVLGPWSRSHLDTITIHDLALSWSEDFPFNPLNLIQKKSFDTVLAVVDIALDIGALGREGEAIGTSFIIGDTKNVLKLSHQVVYNPLKGYRKDERMITSPEVVESIKELAKLDGAFVISETGVVEAAGRHLDARSIMTKQMSGLGSRHRAAAGITRMTDAVAVVVSESTGRVTIFEKGRIVSSLEPVISRRLV